MPKIKTLSKPYPIRLSFRCERAWIYLQKHKVNICEVFRSGGEQAIIDKANEFYFKELFTF